MQKLIKAFKDYEYFRYLGEFLKFHRIQGSEEMTEAQRFLKELGSREGVNYMFHVERMQSEVFGFPVFYGWQIERFKIRIEEIGLEEENDVFIIIPGSKPIKGRFPVQLQPEKGSFYLTDKGIWVENADKLIYFPDHTNGRKRIKRRYWYFSEKDPRYTGIVLTREEGIRIERLLKRGEKVYVDIELDAKFYYPPYNSFLLFKVPGKVEKGILFIAHTCHFRGEGNDNAASSVGLVYSAILLERLIREAKLDLPNYTLYFLLVPEMWGSALFIERYRKLLKNIKLSVNFDMAGSDPEITGSTIYLTRPHGAYPQDMYYEVYQILARIHNYLNFKPFPSMIDFSSGSDHQLFQDFFPSFMLIHWPDKFYHTNQDRITNISIKAILRNFLLIYKLGWEFEMEDKPYPSRDVKRFVDPYLDPEFEVRKKWREKREHVRGYRDIADYFYYYINGFSHEKILKEMIKRGKYPDEEFYRDYREYLSKKEVF